MPAYDTLGDRERNLVLTAQQRGITEAATIANGQSVTGWIAARGCWGLAVDVPASWTSADLAIELSDDASTSLGLLRDDTGEIVRTVVNSTTPAGRYVVKPAAAWAIAAQAPPASPIRAWTPMVLAALGRLTHRRRPASMSWKMRFRSDNYRGVVPAFARIAINIEGIVHGYCAESARRYGQSGCGQGGDFQNAARYVRWRASAGR